MFEPVEEVVVLPAPPVEAVGKPVDFLEKFRRKSGNSAAVSLIGKPVLPPRNSDGEVKRFLLRTTVHCPIVLGKDVDVVEDEA